MRPESAHAIQPLLTAYGDSNTDTPDIGGRDLKGNDIGARNLRGGAEQISQPGPKSGPGFGHF